MRSSTWPGKPTCRRPSAILRGPCRSTSLAPSTCSRHLRRGLLRYLPVHQLRRRLRPGGRGGVADPRGTDPHPRNPYAVSKLAAESLCLQWGITEGWRVLVARPFNHIGPGQKDSFVIASAARQIARMKQGLQANRLEVGTSTSAVISSMSRTCCQPICACSPTARRAPSITSVPGRSRRFAS